PWICQNGRGPRLDNRQPWLPVSQCPPWTYSGIHVRARPQPLCQINDRRHRSSPHSFVELIGIPGDMRREHDVFLLEEWIVARHRLLLKDVQARARTPAFLQSPDTRRFVDDLAATVVDQ